MLWKRSNVAWKRHDYIIGFIQLKYDQRDEWHNSGSL